MGLEHGGRMALMLELALDLLHSMLHIHQFEQHSTLQYAARSSV